MTAEEALQEAALWAQRAAECPGPHATLDGILAAQISQAYSVLATASVEVAREMRA